MATYTVPAATSVWTPGPTSVTVLQKVLVEASGSVGWSPGLYSEVEGAYPTDNYPVNHVFDPGIAIHGLYMGIIAVAAGGTPPLLDGGSRATWMVPKWDVESDGLTRYWTIYPSDMKNSSGANSPWDLYFGMADSNYVDNSGHYTVTTTTTDIEGQVVECGLGGYITDQDLESASRCEKTGLLTPGNRLQVVDGRRIADFAAPWAHTNTENTD
jgi:hypothetical protein